MEDWLAYGRAEFLMAFLVALQHKETLMGCLALLWEFRRDFFQADACDLWLANLIKASSRAAVGVLEANARYGLRARHLWRCHMVVLLKLNLHGVDRLVELVNERARLRHRAHW